MILIPFPQKSKDAKAFGASSQTATFLKSVPLVPVALLSSEDAPETSGDATVFEAGDSSGAGGDQDSPLTYGKVFSMIPRMTKTINTPVINQRISEVFGVPALETSSEFKKIYSSGREALR